MKKLRSSSKKTPKADKKILKKELNKVSGGFGEGDDWREAQRRIEENNYNNTHFKD
ncbi:TPA: hypothetical protein ACPSKB_000884 [Legionella feeleii]